jgi:hypothetical protein
MGLHQVLASADHWSRRGTGVVRFDVASSASFERQARVLAPYLQDKGYRSVVEIGAYPGNILAWFHRTIPGSSASAIEYVHGQANAIRSCFPEFEVLEGDFMLDSTVEPGRTWDVVCSFGLVEHWADVRTPIRRHLAMVAPWGTCVIGIPLHDGVYGRSLRLIQPDLYAKHSRISLVQLETAFREVAGSDWVVDRCTAIGGVGFWNCGLGDWLSRQPAPTRIFGRSLLSAWHRTLSRLPAPRFLRPYGLLIASRHQ